MAAKTLEIIEGPDAGKAVALDRELVIGRDEDADIVVDDGQVSRRHARITPTADGAVVDDLGSTNGTFVGATPVQASTPLHEGGELVVGVTVLRLQTLSQPTKRATAVRTVPAALAAQPRRPTFTDPVSGPFSAPSAIPELERLRDTRVRAMARVAPLAIFVLAALVVIIYLGVTSR